MSGRRLGWLLSLCVGCTSFHDAVLSYDESDAGDASEPSEPERELLDAALDSAALDGAAPDGAVLEPLDGKASEDASAVATDTGTPDTGAPPDAGALLDARTELTCCEMWDAWEDFLKRSDGGLIDVHLPNKPCFEFSCATPPPLPTLP